MAPAPRARRRPSPAPAALLALAACAAAGRALLAPAAPRRGLLAGALLAGSAAGAAEPPGDAEAAYRELAQALRKTVKGIKGLSTSIGGKGSRGREGIERFEQERGTDGIRLALVEAASRFQALAPACSSGDLSQLSAAVDSQDAVDIRDVLFYTTAYLLPYQRQSELDLRPQTDEELMVNGFGQNMNAFVQLVHGKKIQRAKMAYEKTAASLETYIRAIRLA